MTLPKVALSEGTHGRRGWRPDDRFSSFVHVKRAPELWRSRQGYLVHTARSAIVFPYQGGRMVVTWMCGNSSGVAIPVRPECAEGTRPCERCAFAMRKAVPK